MKIKHAIAGGLLAATLPAAQAGLIGTGVLSGSQSGEGGLLGLDVINADNFLGLQLNNQPLLGQAARPGLIGLINLSSLPLPADRGLPALELPPLAGLALLNAGNSANGQLIGLAALSGANSGNGELLGVAVANEGQSGNGGLIGLSLLSGNDSGNSGFAAASLLSGNNSGNIVSGNGLLNFADGFDGTGGLTGLFGQTDALNGLNLTDLAATPIAGLLSVRVVNRPASRTGLVDIGLLNTDFLASLGLNGAPVIQLPPGTPALHDLLAALRLALRDGAGSLTDVTDGNGDALGNAAGASPLGELPVGDLAEAGLASDGDSGLRLIALRLIDAAGTGNGDDVAASILGGGNNANADVAGASVLGGDSSANGGTLGVSLLDGNNSGNGGLIGLAVLSGDNSGSGGLLGASVLSGENTGNGGLLGLALLGGDGSGNTAGDGLGAVQVLSGANSGNGGLIPVSIGGGDNSGNPGTGGLDGLAGLLLLIPADGGTAPALDGQLVGLGLLNGGLDRETGSLVDAGIIENNHLLTLDLAGQQGVQIDLLGPELTALAAGLRDALAQTGLGELPIVLPIPDAADPVAAVNDPVSGITDVALLSTAQGASGDVAGASVLSGSGDGAASSTAGSASSGPGDTSLAGTGTDGSGGGDSASSRVPVNTLPDNSETGDTLAGGESQGPNTVGDESAAGNGQAEGGDNVVADRDANDPSLPGDETVAGAADGGEPADQGSGALDSNSDLLAIAPLPGLETAGGSSGTSPGSAGANNASEIDGAGADGRGEPLRPAGQEDGPAGAERQCVSDVAEDEIEAGDPDARQCNNEEVDSLAFNRFE